MSEAEARHTAETLEFLANHPGFKAKSFVLADLAGFAIEVTEDYGAGIERTTLRTAEEILAFIREYM